MNVQESDNTNVSGGRAAGTDVVFVVENAGETIKNVIEESTKAVESIATTIVEKIPEPVKAVVKEAKNVINSPEGSAVTKAVSTTGLVVAAATATGATATPLLPFAPLDLLSLPFKFSGLLLTALGLRKRFVPWGVIYDSVTKRPLDPAYVVLTNKKTGSTSRAITDVDGRYGFLIDPGVYKIKVDKTNYVFPSKKLAGQIKDELHSDLYFGEELVVEKEGMVITKNIPLDPVKFDWNEFAKKDKNLMKFYSKWDLTLKIVYDAFFTIGFFVAILAFVFANHSYNAVILFIYSLLFVLRFYGLQPKTFGHIIEKATGSPLPFAILRVFISGSEIEIASKPADQYGKYYCLVPPGKYYVKIDKKEADGSYKNVLKSGIINASKKGLIKERFLI